VDWCRRAHAAGYAVLYVPGAHVWHPDTRVRDASSPRVTYYIARNTLRFAAKHRLGRAVTARLVTRYLRTIASWSVRPMWRHKRAQRNALVRALGDFAAGRAGECIALRCV
jgi:GT2 family glycosyltransferase